jgi:hypothetical protein
MEAHARIEVEPAFLTQAEVAVLLGVPERTLEGWRLTRSGPPWLKLGRHVRTTATTCSPGRGSSVMARPKIAAGEVGQVQVTQLASGKWRARARMRDDSGELGSSGRGRYRG